MKIKSDAITKNETENPSFPLSPVVFTTTPARTAPRAINPAVSNLCFVETAQGVWGLGMLGVLGMLVWVIDLFLQTY